jgi:chromosome segregation ATPase
VKGAALLGGLAALTGLAVFVIPASAEVRFASVVVVAIALLAAGGAFFAHRAMGFARRMAAEIVEMHSELARTATEFEDGLNALKDYYATAEQAHATESFHLRRQMDVMSVQLADLRTLHLTDFSRLSAGIESVTTRASNVAEKANATREDLKQARATMDDRHANLTQMIGGLESRLAADSAIVSRTVSEVASLNGVARSLGGSVAAITARSGDLDMTLAAIEGRMAADRSGAADASSKIASLDDLVRALLGQVADVDNRSACLNTAIDALDNKLASDGAIALEARAKVATLDRLVQRLVEQIANTDDRAARFDSELIALQGIVGVERATIEKTRDDVVSLDGLVRSLSDRAAMMDTRIENLDQAFAGLETGLMADRAVAYTTGTEIAAMKVLVGSFSEQVALVVARNTGLGQAVAALESDLAADRATASTLGVEVTNLERFAWLLAERIATLDDFGKQVYCESRLAGENAQKIADDVVGLATRIASVNGSVGRLADSHAYLRSNVSEIGGQLAEMAALSEQVVARTASMLSDFEERLGGIRERTARELALTREQPSHLENAVSAESDTRTRKTIEEQRREWD